MNQQIKDTLATLHRGQQVTVIYDGRFEQQRLCITGKVSKVDHFWDFLEISKIGIDFSEIQEILT
jgi:hypothetical protein